MGQFSKTWLGLRPKRLNYIVNFTLNPLNSDKIFN